MSVLAAASRCGRQAVRPSQPLLVPRRWLGDTVRGPPLTAIGKNFTIACNFFKGATSYTEYKQQCVSLRIFAFAGISAGCVACLVLDPPKSSYWQRWGPGYWWGSLAGPSDAPPLFLSKKTGREVDAGAVVAAVASGKDPAAAKPAAAPAVAALPKVLFVLGGPGAGKGTQCAKIIENYSSWSHISAGDCLRAERQDPNSKDGELINSIIKEGKIVPSEITVSLLEKAMTAQKADGKTSFLIDGFPRSLGNVNAWESVVGDRAQVLGVLFYEANEAEMEKRLLSRGATSGRVDDNIESIKKRFRTYLEETMPIVDKYAAKGMVFSINGMQAVDDVWGVTKATIDKLEKSG